MVGVVGLIKMMEWESVSSESNHWLTYGGD